MTLRYSVEDGIARLVIDRPEKRNALTAAMRREMGQMFEQASADPLVRVLVIEGAGGNFSAGADLGEFSSEKIPASRQRMKHGGLRMVRGLWEMEKPVIAKVEGVAIGLAWCLALASDYVMAGTGARFASPQTKVGLVPDSGAAYLLVRQLGLVRAKALLLSGRSVLADEALALGLVSEVVAEPTLTERCDTLARKLAAGPVFAMGMAKQMLHRAVGPTIDDALAEELLIAPQLRFTEDFYEGIASFREKRSPRYSGS